MEYSKDGKVFRVPSYGKGEAVGGIVVMRYGENAKEVIDRVKQKITDLEKGLRLKRFCFCQKRLRRRCFTARVSSKIMDRSSMSKRY